MRAETDVLVEGFDCDLWANSLWLSHLTGEVERGIFGHILSAQKIWLLRCQGEAPTSMPVVELTEEAMRELHDGWVAVLRAHPENPPVCYQRLNGDPYTQRLFHIARHVLDHGTYHRGELRGLCRGRDDWDFPESGFIGFALERF